MWSDSYLNPVVKREIRGKALFYVNYTIHIVNIKQTQREESNSIISII